jgi:hypothetical protein
MQRSWILGIILCAIHLAIVILGASGGLPHRKQGAWVQGLHWYAMMSGANSQYGFYAPSVGNNSRTRFDLQDESGQTWSDSFEAAKCAEARLRLEGADFPFMNGEAQQSPELRERLVKSWAAPMFTRHPDAVALTVCVESYDVPSMSDYRAGMRPNWNLIYQAHVQRDIAAERERTTP